MKYKINNKLVEVTRAENVKACLIHENLGGEGRKFYLRIYDNMEFNGFIDYEINHQDLDVIICHDAEAAFYDDGENQWLDYSPEVLGLNQVERQGDLRFKISCEVFRRWLTDHSSLSFYPQEPLTTPFAKFIHERFPNNMIKINWTHLTIDDTLYVIPDWVKSLNEKLTDFVCVSGALASAIFDEITPNRGSTP